MYDTPRVQPTRWRLTLNQQARRRDYKREEGAFSIGPKADGQEEWKEVLGYEGRYRVSSFGRVFKIWTRGGGIMKGCTKGSGGYARVHLTDAAGESRMKLVHRIVATAFLAASYKDGLVVNHKDFNTSNNAVVNLEWVTALQNVWHSKRAGRMVFISDRRGGKNGRSKLSAYDVLIIKKEIAAQVPMSVIARQYRVTHGAIAHIKHNRNWQL